MKPNLNERSSSSLVTSQQFFSSHPSHGNTSLLTSIYSTAQSIWHTKTSINLAFDITNLPTGQLAEATITGYDNLGRPNTATITIDDDANGVGWFIDSTPQDNIEFTGTDMYFQAAPNSAASGKYDLLTTILHEMGHTLGIINGYSEFDKYIKGRQFITDTFTATLTPDGSHLDTTFHPYDLMNTSLKPGVRKLPSALNLAMIDAINSGVGGWVSGVGTVNPAHLTAGALTLDPTHTSTTLSTSLTTNDTNVTQIQVINQPTHGTLTQTPDGKLTYQPVSTYVGNDSFTYLGFGSDGQISNLATVNLTINNLPPTIQRIDIPTNIKEGTITTLTATATDIGNDPTSTSLSASLTYRWYINGATTAIQGRSFA
ncbi:Ig-like domain-containing protein [Chamaesiphon minutus]|uniref:Ig-like domain-containing protein n=1 Tax=Chamaesiphon minutus TaxID=1173032 RepID=UPI001E5BB403|nr:Ig-like domain-containing protein [Chamaesiphon minutus]